MWSAVWGRRTAVSRWREQIRGGRKWDTGAQNAHYRRGNPIRRGKSTPPAVRTTSSLQIVETLRRRAVALGVHCVVVCGGVRDDRVIKAWILAWSGMRGGSKHWRVGVVWGAIGFRSVSRAPFIQPSWLCFEVGWTLRCTSTRVLVS